eukprot:CAMPEP_0177378292 /NCGR_PEP_ID=MMETSP0368-20130122/46251_1 /TAXON_ID=447022 ORGANISM="Scrippsiella hangoei-like, Strain SHHI-4" /NCGR_SAMPLE_ID=MMETSP0368 /ASSEMBLY_ACC=CAM_ASM_000363 /LENGTH=194 /DNA_ID=CAMNT_0018842221 /DNA_START=59 /DNA_END=641 /DNA_ORIENTATION=-
MTRLLVASLALLGVPAAAYVVPGVNSAPQLRQRSCALPQLSEAHVFEEMPEVAPEASGFGLVAASVAVGAMLGWFNSRRQQVASVAGAAALAMAPAAGLAIVDYDAVKYLGGSDKVDINNANVQAYRQFPGMYPTAAGAIGSHGPYKSVKDIYDIPGLTEQVKGIMKKYEGQFVCLPVNEAYFIDRINNGMYAE